MKVKFWGTRGSLPRPLTAAEFRAKARKLLLGACDVDLCDETAVDAFLDSRPLPESMTFGGNTPCVEITHDGGRVICDCGSALRDLGASIKDEFTSGGEIDILQTHTHWDHMMGFPFFAPAYMKGVAINIYGIHPKLRERFEQQMDTVHFPITMDDMASTSTFHQVHADDQLSLGPFTVTCKGLHHPGGSYAYKLRAGGKTVVYATDGEYKDGAGDPYKQYVDFFEGVDVLIFDAMYANIEKTIEKENFGHSTAIIGIELALRANVKSLVLFHHDTESSDEQIIQSRLEAIKMLDSCCTSEDGPGLEVIASYDGFELEV
jgi:phosphoribosyl 1,2-cyclic phosphodiesterase